MEINIADAIKASTRHIGSREHDGKTARILTATRTYDTTIDDLWQAVTTPERIARWFLPIEGDLRLGGTYQLKGNAGGTILGCEPPRQFNITWEFAGNTSWVNVNLSPVGDGTNLKLEHIALVSDEMWDQFGPGAVGVGWDMTLLGLDQHLAKGESFDPHEGMAWMGSAEGKAFITDSSTEWRDASIAFGTPEEQATAAAERTTAAYTGTPPPEE